MLERMATKAVESFEIKDADRGEVTAVVSTFNVVDRDGDVVLPGAIKDGTTVKLSAYNHDVITEGAPPAGKGVIRVDGDRAVLHARYFMSTERGRNAFAQVKEMGSDSEWSVGFWRNVETVRMTDAWREKGARRLIAKMIAVESSPVFMGANQFTHTLAAKQADGDPGDEPSAPAEDPEIKAIAGEVTRQVMERRDAERKAKEEADAEVARKAQEDADAKAKSDADAEAARKAAEQDVLTKEFEKFERNMRRVA